MSKGFLAVIAAVVLIFIGIFAFSGNKSGSNDKSSSKDNSQPTSHIEGKGQAGVLLVEYGDYQCPVCERYYPAVKQVTDKYNDQIRFQFRNYPLVGLHQNAFAGARAAEAAALQGKFWKMHDLLFENQTQWAESSSPIQYFRQYAKQLGLNIDQFNKDFSSNKVNDAVNADKAAGDKLKVQGTPAFFLNGKQVQFDPNIESFSKQIDEAIRQKQSQN